jgi:hypothetical protein
MLDILLEASDPGAGVSLFAFAIASDKHVNPSSDAQTHIYKMLA